MASSKYSGSPSSVGITHSYGGYPVEGRRCMMDLLNSGSTSGASGSRGAYSTGSTGPSLFSSPTDHDHYQLQVEKLMLE